MKLTEPVGKLNRWLFFVNWRNQFQLSQGISDVSKILHGSRRIGPVRHQHIAARVRTWRWVSEKLAAGAVLPHGQFAGAGSLPLGRQLD